MKALIIKKPWIDYILAGEKTWEIRGSATHIRGKILLIQSKTKTIVGEANLTGCIELTPHEYFNRTDKHCIPTQHKELPYKKIYAWVIQDAVRYDVPIPYDHPKGAIIWVNIQ